MLLGVKELESIWNHVFPGDFILILEKIPLDYLDEIVSIDISALTAKTVMWDERGFVTLSSDLAFSGLIDEINQGDKTFVIVLKWTDFEIIADFKET